MKQENSTSQLSSSELTIPDRLKNIPQPPKKLFYKGSSDLKLSPSIAIVGTRKPTQYGVAVTKGIASELAKQNITIISGMALGIDSIAHKASLEAGGKTIAVLPCSIEFYYPKSHTNLGKQILKQDGTIVSEYSDKEDIVHKSRFIERNRLVAGLADMLLITEAAEKSGTISTANFALDQGKTVLVVPGNITSVMSRGTNNLIKEGALPVTSISDVLEVLGISEDSKTYTYESINPAEEKVLKFIKQGIFNKEELLKKSGLEPQEFNIIITKFEILKIL